LKAPTTKRVEARRSLAVETVEAVESRMHVRSRSESEASTVRTPAMKRIETLAKALPLSLAAAAIGVVGAVGATGSAHAAIETLPTSHHLELSDHSAQTKSVERASLRYAAPRGQSDAAQAARLDQAVVNRSHDCVASK